MKVLNVDVIIFLAAKQAPDNESRSNCYFLQKIVLQMAINSVLNADPAT